MQATAILQQDELSTLIAKIKGSNQSEREQAESLSRCLYGRPVEELDLQRARSLWQDLSIKRQRRYERANPTPGICFHCGENTGTAAIEHRHCREGFTEGEFNRSYRNSF
jgi:hypothetical protein